MVIKIKLIFTVFTIVTFFSNAQEKPNLPFIAKDVCPFECCTYGKWMTKKNLVVYEKERDTSKFSFIIDANSSFNAITGNVHVTKLGNVKVSKPFQLMCDNQEIKFNSEDRIYPLFYTGEGYYKCWFKSKTLSISCDEWGCEVFKSNDIQNNCILIIEPNYEWWVEIIDNQGRKGWIFIKEDLELEGPDACS